MQRYWTAGNIVAVVAFVSVALLPWLWVLGLAGLPELLAALVAWLVIGTVAAANASTWVRRKP